MKGRQAVRPAPARARRTGVLAIVLGALVALALAGCGSARGSTSSPLQVVASFYPLEFVAQRVGGDAVRVSTLTRPGAEPHDLELTARDVGGISQADLVVYLRGFQPAVDAAVEQNAASSALDVSAAARLDLTYAPGGARDLHFWLDPTRLASVAAAVADRLSRLDPGRAQDFAANAAALEADLALLDRELAAGLRDCASTYLVTSHAAFGYLADRYGLTQAGITGLTPDAEPSPAELTAAIRFVREHQVRTVYFETLVSPAVARTVAAETGARTAVLDPIEGITDQSRGQDYLAVMRANLQTLRAGQGCR